MSELETFAKAKADVEEFAAKGFARHQITRTPEGDYRCKRPDSGNYAFRVILRPGTVIVWGDIGDWILRHSDRDSLGWLRGAVNCWDYLLGKVVAGKEEHFYEGDVVAWIDRLVAEGNSAMDAIEEAVNDAIEDGTFCRDRWGEIALEHGLETEDASVGTNYSASMLWLVEALKWFVAHIDGAEAEAPAVKP